jgi:hypothetical protein
MVEATGLKVPASVTLNGMTSVLNLIRIYKLVQNVIRVDRQDGDLISLHFTFRNESRPESGGGVL